MNCQTCQTEITSASHCSNINRSVLPFGVLDVDSTTEQKQQTAAVLAACVRQTVEEFPSDARGYKRGLCAQAASCAIADEDWADMRDEITHMIFQAL